MIFFLLPLAFVISLAGNLALEKYAHHLRLMDPPGHRKLQKAPIPRAGGLALTAALVIVSLMAGRFSLNLAAAGALIVFLGGLYDDRRPSNSVVVKICFQSSGAILFAAHLYFALGTPLLLAILAAAFVFLMINSFNLMDNMNGLTAGMSLVLFIAFYFEGFAQIVPTLIIAGALLGFLVRNWPAGRIFLGDQGSQFLGYWTSQIALQGLLRNTSTPPSFSLLALSLGLLIIAFLPFIFDTLLVIVIRLRNGVPITVGDQNHLSFQLLKTGLTTTSAPAVIVFIQSACAITSYLWGQYWLVRG